MSYYRPSFSQTVAMSRGRGFSSSRGSSSYRGGGSRGSSSWNSRGSYQSSNSNSRFSSSFSNSFDSRSKYNSSDRYPPRSNPDNYRKSYRSESSGYSGRDAHRSPERKRMRTDTLSSRHDSSYGPDSYNRYESSGYQERRSFSGDRRPPPISRREEFRKPAPPSSSRGSYRGRISSRGSIRRLREAPIKRTRLVSNFARRRMTKLRSVAIRRYRRDDDDDEKEQVKSEEKEIKKEKETPKKQEEEKTGEEEEKLKSPKKEKVEGATSEKEDKKEESDDDEERPKRKLIRLNCPQCAFKCSTFKKYNIHLRSGRHMAVMRRVAMKQKAILHQMRLAQRKAQKELEKTTDDLAPRTNFCPLCKLNYKQPKATHRSTEAHKNMKKFLMPYCKVCKITLKSPMLYEDHLCSIEHLKQKSMLINGDKSDEGSGDDNLENFMTIDSVGDMEDEEGAENKKSTSSVEKPQINVGIESIRKVEVHYCDLCLMYLPRVEESEVANILAKHCRQRTHMQRYIRYKEDKEIAKRAEKLQRKETAEKERDKDKDKDGKEKTEKVTADKKPKEENHAEDEGEDKLWADVDKDLGDILAEAESGNKSSDEDDNGERYDRFKLSEGKNGEDKKLAENEEVEGGDDSKVEDGENEK